MTNKKRVMQVFVDYCIKRNGYNDFRTYCFTYWGKKFISTFINNNGNQKSKVSEDINKSLLIRIMHSICCEIYYEQEIKENKRVIAVYCDKQKEDD